MDCLKGEFDVEPGDGGSRCDYLDEKGIETYLIIASKPEVKKTAQNGLNGSVSPLSKSNHREEERKGFRKEQLGVVWCYTPEILAHRRLRQDFKASLGYPASSGSAYISKFKASLGCVARSCVKKIKLH